MTTGDPLLDFAIALRSAALDPIMVALSKANSETAYLALLPLIYWLFSRRLGFLLLMADAVATAAAVALKNTLALPRPPDAGETSWLDDPSTVYGFPSGHVTATAATWSSVAALLKSRRIALFAAAATASVGFSRLYLGVHYSRDVAGGAILGAAAGLVLWLALPRLERRICDLRFLHKAALLLLFPAFALVDRSAESLIILSAGGGAAAGEIMSSHLKWELARGDPRTLPLYGAVRVALGFPVLALLAVGLGSPVDASGAEIVLRFAALGVFTTLIGPKAFALIEARAARPQPPAPGAT